MYNLQMKMAVRLAMVFVSLSIVNAQVSFSAPYFVTQLDNEVLGDLIAADLNGDSYLDIVYKVWISTPEQPFLYWNPNINGTGSFSDRILVSDSCGTTSLNYADIDGDQDMDLISGGGEITWLENTDGAGTFEEHFVTQLSIWSNDAVAADLDGDEDLDILFSARTDWDLSDDGIFWCPNLDGLGAFGDRNEIEIGCGWPVWSHPADADGDGDLDVFFLSSYDCDPGPAWRENVDGAGNFDVEHFVSTYEDSTWSFGLPINVVDLDNDGDLDVMGQIYYSGSWETGSGWSENTDGLGTFSEVMFISNDKYHFVADLDNDGDMDLIGTSGDDPEVYGWYENTDGQATFGPSQAICDTLQIRTSADIDGDGDLDLIATSVEIIYWIENLMIVTNISQEVAGLPDRFGLANNYPNPFNPTTTISYDLPEQSAVSLKVYDIRGQKILTLLNTQKPPGNYEVQWDGLDQLGNPVSTGVYFCRLSAGSFSQTIKMVYLR